MVDKVNLMEIQPSNYINFYLFKELKVQKTIHWEIPNFTKEVAENISVGEKNDSKTALVTYDQNETEWYVCLKEKNSI